MVSAGRALALGECVWADGAAARAWLARAAEEHRSAVALRFLGTMLLAGDGGAAEPGRGWAYLLMAAAAGDDGAQAALDHFEPRVPARERDEALVIARDWATAHGVPRTDE